MSLLAANGWGAGFGVALVSASILWAWLFMAGPFRRAPFPAPSVAPIPAPEGSAEWRRQRASWLADLDAHVYGPPPPLRAITVTEKRSAPATGYSYDLEHWRVDFEDAGSFNLVLATPRRSRPFPVILVQTYCGNRAAVPGRPAAIDPPQRGAPIACAESFDPIARLIFGEHINAPPLERITRRGYGVALFYGGDLVPDRERDALAALERFAPQNTGALSAWAWLYSRAADALEADPRVDANRLIAFGQSRQGKVALLAGARDERFAAVVSLQAGRGGDALTRHREGESVRAITRRYPHWFAPAFVRFQTEDPPIDQSHLLAAIAPRHLLIGHARRDAWSDPTGALQAVNSSKSIFASLRASEPHFYLRRGRHGITPEDWTRTLNFLDERLSAPPRSLSRAQVQATATLPRH